MTRPIPLSVDRLSWNLYSYGLIFLYAFFQVMQWPLLPRFLDVYYHLGVMKGFADAGGYVTTAFWEYAPSGRPHLYPPALHLIMLALFKTGFSAITIARLVDCLSYPALLFCFHRLLKEACGPRTAFLALLGFASAYSALLASVTLSAFNLSVVWGLLALWQVRRRNTGAAAGWLALCFYTHTLGAGLFVLTVVLYGLFKKDGMKVSGVAVLAALALASPLLWYQWRFRQYFAFVPVHENRHWECDLTLYALALGACWQALRSKNRDTLLLPMSLCLGFLPILFTHQTRFFAGHGLMAFSGLAAVFVDDAIERTKKNGAGHGPFLMVLSFSLWMLLAAPVFHWDLKKQEGGVRWADRSLTRYVWPDRTGDIRPNSFSIYFPEDYARITQIIRDHSAAGDILWTDFSYTAGILGILSERATSCAMLAEVRPFEKRDALQDARILVWLKDKNMQASPEMMDSVKKRGLTVLKETEMAFVLMNPDARSKSARPRAVIPTMVLMGVFFSLLVSLGWMSRKNP